MGISGPENELVMIGVEKLKINHSLYWLLPGREKYMEKCIEIFLDTNQVKNQVEITL